MCLGMGIKVDRIIIQKLQQPLVIFVNRRLARYGATVNIPFGALQRDNMKFESSKVFQNSRRVPFLEAGLLRYT